MNFMHLGVIGTIANGLLSIRDDKKVEILDMDKVSIGTQTSLLLRVPKGHEEI